MSNATTLPTALRQAHYEAQNAGRPLTPAQRRRIRAKDNADTFGTAGKGRLKKRFEEQGHKRLRTSVRNALALVRQLRQAGGVQHLAAIRAAEAQALAQREAALRAQQEADNEEKQ